MVSNSLTKPQSSELGLHIWVKLGVLSFYGASQERVNSRFTQTIRMKRIIKIEVDGQVQWRVTKTPAGNWVGVCDPFALTMEGDSLDDLYSSIDETIQLLFEDLFEDGELEEFLKARGWTARPMVPGADGDLKFAVPFELLVQSDADTARPLH